MKVFLLYITLILPLVAEAKMPLRELDSLKQIIIVSRVAINEPFNPDIVKCKIKSDGLEAKLQKAKDNAKKSWSRQVLTKSDMPLLSKAIQGCATRVTCEVYDSFITSVKVEPGIEAQVEPLKIVLDQNLQQLTKDSYKAAFPSVKNPCSLLKAISR
ncbi:hypothetical protein ACLVWU_03125 [Bdellovibrio sp. HCB290]|uniref:hypothetical protein n=1 Tax=Bdellovibrio sp. HCB290 TaxID=3394356 RepID=UPI0039B6E5E1